MELFFSYIQKHRGAIIACALIAGSLALLLSLLRPLEYSSSVRLLILQKNQSALDPYTALKSAEQVGDTLSQVVYTSAFFDRVLQTDTTIDQKLFSENERKKRKVWGKMIETQSGRGNGFLKVTVYHRDRSEARKIVQAITNVLVAEGWQYVNSDITVRVVDAPLDSRFPVRPDIPVNVFIGCIFGALLGSVFILFNERKKVKP
ncbi:MAG: hypothetical protein Q7R79_03285 [bacterium]|nr:hypothetical protein [bacterium]